MIAAPFAPTWCRGAQILRSEGALVPRVVRWPPLCHGTTLQTG